MINRIALDKKIGDAIDNNDISTTKNHRVDFKI